MGFEWALNVILGKLQQVFLIPQVFVLWFWARKYRVKNFRAFVHDVRVILRSDLFREQYYRGASKNPKPGNGFFQQTRLISHFLEIGAKEGLDPNPLFSVRFYLNAYPDVRQSQINPLIHYIYHGGKEGRSTHPLFDGKFYQRQILDDLNPSDTPLGDFLKNGVSAERNPCLLFDCVYYLSQEPGLTGYSDNPLIHYLEVGAYSGFDPHKYFASTYYLRRYSAEIPKGTSALEYFLYVGGHNGHHPSPDFDTSYYLEVGPDIGKAGAIPLVHYLEFGYLERRQPKNFYGQWLDSKESQSSEGACAEEIAHMPYRPIFSVIMPVFNTDQKLLREAIGSVVDQIYPHWELCVANDGSSASHIRPMLDEYQSRDSRIRVMHRSKSGHISVASNAALSLATGEFVALLDHDDLLDPSALLENARCLNANPRAMIVYSDEDKINTKGLRYEPFFKPDWSPELLLSQMYLGHLGVYRRDLIEEIGGFREGYEGSQDFDLILRASELTDKIFHIPRVLYHWRTGEGSTAGDPKAKEYAYVSGEKALQDAADRRDMDATSYRVPKKYGQYALEFTSSNAPKVSVLIPIREGLSHEEQLGTVLQSVALWGDYPKLEIVVIVQRSGEAPPPIFPLKLRDHLMAACPSLLSEDLDRRFDKLVQLVISDCPSSYSQLINSGVENSGGEFVFCLDGSTMGIEALYGEPKNSLSQMLGYMRDKEVGAVGGLSVDSSDSTVISSGLVANREILVADMHCEESVASSGYFGRLVTPSDCTAVRLECLLTRRSLIEERGGLHEYLPSNLAALDYGLWLRDNGFRTVMLPQIRFFQNPDSFEGAFRDPKNQKFNREVRERFLEKWDAALPEVDPYYNPNLIIKGHAARFDLDLSFKYAESLAIP